MFTPLDPHQVAFRNRDELIECGQKLAMHSDPNIAITGRVLEQVMVHVYDFVSREIDTMAGEKTTTDEAAKRMALAIGNLFSATVNLVDSSISSEASRPIFVGGVMAIMQHVAAQIAAQSISKAVACALASLDRAQQDSEDSEGIKTTHCAPDRTQ
jgi:hypothetical protein